MCTNWVVVANSLEGTALTCTSFTGSRSVRCAAGSWNDDARAWDLGTTCIVVANSLDGTALTCTSSTTSKIVACAAGFWNDLL